MSEYQGNHPEKKLHEVNYYSDKAFPIGVYVVTKHGITPQGRGYMELHWHEELQFTYVIKGFVKIQVNTEVYQLHEGDGIFINRNLLHITIEISDDGEYVSINFPDKILGFFQGSRLERDFVQPYTGNYNYQALVLQRTQDWQKKVLEKLSEITTLFFHGGEKFDKYFMMIKIVEVWFVMIENLEEPDVALPLGYIKKQKRILQMLAYIQENYMHNIQLKDIAESANVSVGECCRCFQELVGKTPTQYIMGYRITQSMELLSGTDLLVTDIAFAVGFNDSSYYVHCFKKNVGMTPKEYRKGKC